MFVHSFLASIKSCFLFSAFLSDKAWTINLQAMSCEIIRLCETIHWSTCKTHVMWIPNWENLKNYFKGEYWVYSHLTGSVKWWCWEVCQMILCLILIWYVSQDSLASYDPGYIYFYPSVWPCINSFIDRRSTLPRHVFCFDDVDILNTDHWHRLRCGWHVLIIAEGLFVNVVKR